MFFDELTPIFKELTQQPVAFMGGLFSGLLRLNLSDEPIRNWLDKQSSSSSYSTTRNGNGPQSISID